MPVHFLIRVILITLFLFRTVASASGLITPCHYSDERSGRFTSNHTDDTIFVSVTGKPCYDGHLRIVIKNSNSKIVYEYETSMRGLTAPPESDDTLHEFARSLVRTTIERAFSGTSDSLPIYGEISWRESPLVSKEDYESIRKRALPSLTHPAGEEGWLTIVADPEVGSTIAVMGGSW